ncbi:hypothetical protein D3C72_1131610 [compost metagenome]
MVLMLGVWGVFGVLDQVFTKDMGPFVAINELMDSTGNIATGTKPPTLKIGGQDVEPKYNVYSTEGKNKETYTYSLGNKEEVYLFLNYGIPDGKELRGSIRITVDGEEFLSISAEGERHEPDMSSIYLSQAKELTITIEGNETLWDVGFREMVYTWN